MTIICGKHVNIIDSFLFPCVCSAIISNVVLEWGKEYFEGMIRVQAIHLYNQNNNPALNTKVGNNKFKHTNRHYTMSIYGTPNKQLFCIRWSLSYPF